MIPVYEKYKDKGFVIVGVAREKRIADALRAIEKDKYPWLNLIELNDQHKIWEKYGIGNAAGGTFLVDENGIMLDISPDADKVSRVLEERLP